MLFKTVYGPELQCLFEFIAKFGPLEKDALYNNFLPMVNGQPGNSTNLDDAIHFLLSSGVLRKNNTGKYQAINVEKDFKMNLLVNLRLLQTGKVESTDRLDPWYLGLIENAYIIPNKKVLFDLHQLFNALWLPAVLSEEKVNAWKRVLEFIGLGYRVFGGFYCIYSLQLVRDIVDSWEEAQGPLQNFLEDCFSLYLPWQTKNGDIAGALWSPLEELERQGYITLVAKQDSPSRAYGGQRRVKWLVKGGKEL